jgi:hypothetical protein
MLNRIFHQAAIPREYQSNFMHLYLDIAWFGVLSGSTVNFLNIYAARIGSTGLQIGLIGAMAAIVNLFLAYRSRRWGSASLPCSQTPFPPNIAPMWLVLVTSCSQ